jgi:hypothetical protein
MSMLPRLKPKSLDDLTIEVAVVRPGPIQGQMVHPYLRCREGTEPVVYPTPEFEKVLGKTLGVPLFQEQAMLIAIHCAGFTPGQADELRRAMATFKYTGGGSHLSAKLIGEKTAKGDPAFAETTFSQFEGFGSDGFPMSHAASFAILAYASSWMKYHHPINKRIADRGYQQRCIDALCEEINRGRRKLLVEMATGTGKTRTAAALVKRLFEAGLVGRVLFLVDRVSLAKQAEDALAEHLPAFVGALTGSHYGKQYFLSVARRTTGIATINKTGKPETASPDLNQSGPIPSCEAGAPSDMHASQLRGYTMRLLHLAAATALVTTPALAQQPIAYTAPAQPIIAVQ